MTQDPKMLALADLTALIEKAMNEWEHDQEAPDTMTCAQHVALTIRTASERPAAGEREKIAQIKESINRLVSIKERWDGLQILEGLDQAADEIMATLSTPTAPAGDGIAPIGFDETEEQYIARLEAEVARLRSSDRTAVIKECAEVAEGFRRQMPPGADRVLVRKIEDAIMGLAHSSTDRGGK